MLARSLRHSRFSFARAVIRTVTIAMSRAITVAARVARRSKLTARKKRTIVVAAASRARIARAERHSR